MFEEVRDQINLPWCLLVTWRRLKVCHADRKKGRESAQLLTAQTNATATNGDFTWLRQNIFRKISDSKKRLFGERKHAKTQGHHFENKFVQKFDRGEFCKSAERSTTRKARGKRNFLARILLSKKGVHTWGIWGAGEQKKQSATVAAVQHCA